MYGPAWFLYAILSIEGLLLFAGLLLVALVASFVTQFSRFALRRCCSRNL
jgi:hypothetical protein